MQKKVLRMLLFLQLLIVADMNSKLYIKKKKNETRKNENSEMKLVPIIMRYCLLQFDALKLFLGIRLNEGSLSNLNFFNVSPQI